VTNNHDHDDAWNSWAEAHVDRGMDAVADALGAEVGAIERKIREDLRAEISALKEQVGGLKCELSYLRGRLDHREPLDLNAEKTSIVAFGRKRDPDAA
jgi:hypothetical protein